MSQARSNSGEAEVLARHMSHTPGAPSPVQEMDTDLIPSPYNSTWKVLDVQRRAALLALWNSQGRLLGRGNTNVGF